MNRGYEVGTSVWVSAFHRQPDVPGPESDLHSHEYRIDVVVERTELDQRGMVCDLDGLNDALRGIASRVDGRNLDEIRPRGAEAVTVEVFARWAHEELTPTVRAAGAEALSVRVWESAEGFGGYRGPVR